MQLLSIIWKTQFQKHVLSIYYVPGTINTRVPEFSDWDSDPTLKNLSLGETNKYYNVVENIILKACTRSRSSRMKHVIHSVWREA